VRAFYEDAYREVLEENGVERLRHPEHFSHRREFRDDGVPVALVSRAGRRLAEPTSDTSAYLFADRI
jgi:hypothetical protein